MPDVDFFNFFRYVLGTVVTIYATIVTIQSIYTWYIYLNSRERYISMVRRYIIVHGLRLRFKSFWGDVLICILLSVVFILLLEAHRIVQTTLPATASEIAQSNVHRANQSDRPATAAGTR